MRSHTDLSGPEHLISPEHRLITLVGAGGKTSIVEWLASTLQSKPLRVIITTTTKIFPLPEEITILQDDGPNFSGRIRAAFESASIVVVARRHDQKTGKLIGLSPDTVAEFKELGLADVILAEADGAAHKPLKAPNDSEPVIPENTDLCIGVMGLDAIDGPLCEERVHRHGLFSKVTGLLPGETITPEHMISLVRNSRGLFRGCPEKAERKVFLNKVDVHQGYVLAEEFRILLDRYSNTGSQWFAGSARDKLSYIIS